MMSKYFLICLLLFAFNPVQALPNGHNFAGIDSIKRFEAYLKTDLFFGMDKGDGTVVTDDEWNEFLKDIVTPRFPDGLTVLEGYGQYRDGSGKIVRERSKVLVILYPVAKRKSSSRKIDEIRKSYKAKFQQESVLRIDYPRLARLEF